MKTKEELNELKKEVEAFNDKLSELTEEEMVQVTGGAGLPFISRHNIRSPLTGMININLDGYDYSLQKKPITIDQPDRVYEEDERPLSFIEKQKR